MPPAIVVATLNESGMNSIKSVLALPRLARNFHRWRSGVARPTVGSAFALAALIVTYLLPGVVGHDPWKQDEAYTFGIVLHMLESGDWVVPTLAGQPFMEKPPLF